MDRLRLRLRPVASWLANGLSVLNRASMIPSGSVAYGRSTLGNCSSVISGNGMSLGLYLSALSRSASSVSSWLLSCVCDGLRVISRGGVTWRHRSNLHNRMCVVPSLAFLGNRLYLCNGGFWAVCCWASYSN